MAFASQKNPLNQSFDEIRHQFGACTMEVARAIYYKANYAKRTPKYGLNRNGQNWFYQTLDALAEELGYSARQIHRAIKMLIEAGYVLKEKFWKFRGTMVNFYTFVTESFSQQMSESFGQNVNMYIQPLPTTINKSNKSRSYPQAIKNDGSDDQQVHQVEQVRNVLNTNEEGKKPLNTTAQDMLRIWNEKFGQKAPEVMSKELAPRLVAAFNNKFDSDMDKWRGYCDLIKSSPFLMGETWELHLNWILRYQTIDQICDGKFSVQVTKEEIDIKRAQSMMEPLDDAMVAQIDKLAENDEIKAVRKQLLEMVGAAEYKSWFHGATFTKSERGISISTGVNIVADRWEMNFMKHLDALKVRVGNAWDRLY